MSLKYISDPVEGMEGLRPFKGSAVKITVHTTETAVKPNWQEKRKGLPHYTLDGDIVYSHIPLDMAAYTLIGGDFSPNSDAGVNIQIEWVGFAENTPDRSDEDYASLAELMFDISQKVGCPWEFPFPFTGSNGWGPSGTVRQSWAKFEAANGIVGHSHAPYNNHWDPGVLDVERLTLLKPRVPGCDYEKIEDLIRNQARVDEVLAAVRSISQTTVDIQKAQFDAVLLTLQEASAKMTTLQQTVEDLEATMMKLRFVIDVNE